MAKTRTSFKKGEIHNPKGAPKREWTWSGVLEKAVQESLAGGGQVKELVAKSLIKQALTGDVHAIKELMNRMDGMPHQSTDLTTQGDKIDGITVTIVDAKNGGEEDE